MTHAFDVGFEVRPSGLDHVQGFYVVGPNLPATPGAPAVGTNVGVGTTLLNPALVGGSRAAITGTTLDNPNPE